MSQPLAPSDPFIVERDNLLSFALAYPLIFHHINGDAVEKRTELCFSPKVRQGAKQPQENLLRHIIEILSSPGQAGQQPEDGTRMLFDDSVESFQADHIRPAQNQIVSPLASLPRYFAGYETKPVAAGLMVLHKT
jgi:hypothetical protein